MNRVKNIWKFIVKAFSVVKEHTLKGYKWMGTDGLLNLETSALITIMLMLLLPPFGAGFITLVIMCAKCISDSLKGRENEEHDLICSIIGLVLGIIIGIA